MIIPMARLQAEYGVAPTAVLHVGAHLGEEAAAYAAAGVERVLWVEANPHLIGQLIANILPYPGQKAVQAAVSDVDGATATLHLASFTMASSLLPPREHLRIYPHITYTETVAVETVTVDTLLDRLHLAHESFDMANLDVEGAELRVLKGMGRVLPHLKWLYLEVNHREMYEGCALVEDIDAYLGSRNFRRLVMENEGWDHGFSDALYARVRRGLP